MPYDVICVASKMTANGLTAIVPSAAYGTLAGYSQPTAGYIQTRDIGMDTWLSEATVTCEGTASVINAAILSPQFQNVTKTFGGARIANSDKWTKRLFEAGVHPPIPLGRQGQFLTQVDNSNVAGHTLGVTYIISYGEPAGSWMDGLPGAADIRYIDGSAEDACTAFVWSQNACSFAGAALDSRHNYLCLGAVVRGANIFGWRFVVPGGSNFRPGVAGSCRLVSDTTDGGSVFLRRGGRFEFRGNNPPSIEIFSGVAETPIIQLIAQDLG